MEVEKLKLTEKRLEICRRLDLKDSLDVLRYYPFKYENLELTHYDNFKIGSQVCFEALVVSSPSVYRYRGNRSVSKFKVLYEEEELLITIFNRPWIKNVALDQKITIIGKYEGNNKVTALNYYSKGINEIIGINSYYSLKEGIKQNEIKKLIEYVLSKCEDELVDYIPSSYIKKHNLISFKDAIKNIHFPDNELALKKAISRLKYEEFLNFYSTLELMRDKTNNTKTKKEFSLNDIELFIETLPYELTKDQRNATEDILSDLKSNKTMHRLIQGEVGSGKTAVAMISMYANYLANYQGVLMAPTEILARQHYSSFINQFKDTNIKIALLCSGVENVEQIKTDLKNGDIDIVIGTHALLEDDVIFNNLGLVIADEQQRFGVKQRRKLKDKGKNVDLILMSATPIPRTLASSLYGDMDISTIETLPVGRKGCDTFFVNKNSIIDILEDLKNELSKGKQMYIISAAIEKSNNYNAKDAVGLYESLIDALKPYKLGLLHGRLSSEEKENIMNDFYQNNIQVLVSTTVVEVGVNVKNASIIVVYDADKFGLSQLHQLRGRIQRGNEKGLCYLLSDTKDEMAKQRINVLVNSNDGFEISLADLKLRGPGDILGTRQSGLPTFILGNLLKDNKFIEAAKKDAKEIMLNIDNNENKAFFNRIQSCTNKSTVD